MADSLAAVDPEALLPGVTALARTALEEFTPADTIGDLIEAQQLDDGVLRLRFAPRLLGYPGWSWIVDAVQVGDGEVTILETELIPGEGALLAPEWVPWAQRLAEFRAAQKAAAAEAALAELEASDDADLDDDEVDGEDIGDEVDDDFDPQDDDEDADDPDAARLHSGDLDGVDIDELDPEALEASYDDESGEEE